MRFAALVTRLMKQGLGAAGDILGIEEPQVKLDPVIDENTGEGLGDCSSIATFRAQIVNIVANVAPAPVEDWRVPAVVEIVFGGIGQQPAGIESPGQWFAGIAAIMPAESVIPVVLVAAEAIGVPGIVSMPFP